MPKLWWLIAGLLPWGLRFAHRAASVGFVVANVELGWAFSELFGFPVNIIALLLHIHSCFIWGLDSVSGSRCSSTETLPLHKQ
jgi:hypothetical protein